MTTYRKAKGGKELQRYLLDNKRLSPRQMILAKCYECMNQYADGRIDCTVKDCSLYPVMPYGDHPVFKSRSITPKHLQKLKQGRKGHGSEKV